MYFGGIGLPAKKFERENHGKKIFECDTRAFACAFARIVKFKSGEFRI